MYSLETTSINKKLIIRSFNTEELLNRFKSGQLGIDWQVSDKGLATGTYELIDGKWVNARDIKLDKPPAPVVK